MSLELDRGEIGHRVADWYNLIPKDMKERLMVALNYGSTDYDKLPFQALPYEVQCEIQAWFYDEYEPSQAWRSGYEAYGF